MKRRRGIMVLGATVLLLGGLYLALRSPAVSPEVQARAYSLTVRGERVVSGPTVLEAWQGDPITIAVTADRPGMVYIHGYERMVDVEPEREATLAFRAEFAGRYAVDLHGADSTHTELAALEVQPR